MNLINKTYVIMEIIPTNTDPKKGDIAQLSALKVNGKKIEDRFDYRIDKDKINILDILNMLDYDNDSFTYCSNSKEIMKAFKKFIEDLPILIIDNEYTNNYLKDIKNKKESIFKYFGIDITNDAFDKLMDKYKLMPSNHLVDILYEALMMEI